MASKNYQKNNKSNASTRGSYKSKIFKYKVTNMYRVLLVIVVLIAIAIIVQLQYTNHVYTEYDVTSIVPRTKTVDSKDERLGYSILTYSKDGAHCTDEKGSVLWNQTYEIQDIKVVTAGGVVAIGNYNGRDIYVLDETKQLTSITTTLPIRNLAVSKSGCVSAVLADTDVTYIKTYNAKGENIFSGTTHMSNSGYPMALALSPSGEMLAVSYVYVDAGTVKSTVGFYNFGPVGDNYKDYKVNGFDYSDMLIPEIGFMDDKTAYAVGDGRLMIYQGEEMPTIKSEYLYDEEVKAVYAGEGHVGLVFDSKEVGSTYRLQIYDNTGSMVNVCNFSRDFTEILFEKDDFIIYSDSECYIETYTGKVKFDGKFSENVNCMIPTSGAYKYLLVGDDAIRSIQLK